MDRRRKQLLDGMFAEYFIKRNYTSIDSLISQTCSNYRHAVYLLNKALVVYQEHLDTGVITREKYQEVHMKCLNDFTHISKHLEP